MRRTLRFASLAFGLSMLICATAAQAQPKQQIRLRDEMGKTVPNAKVIIDCDETKREGLTDKDGIFSWTPIPAPTQCALIVSSTQSEILADVLDIPANGLVNATFVLKQKPGSLAKTGCPPDQLRRDGSCGTPDKAREIDALDKKGCPEPLLMRYGFCVTPDRAREIDALDFNRDCPKPNLLRYGNCITANEARRLDTEGAFAACKRRGRGWIWRGGSPNNPSGYCVSDTEIAAAEAADDAECSRTLTGSHAGWVGEATWGCMCPPGYVPDAAGKKCVQIKPAKTGQDSIFVGTWNGTGSAKGITVTFKEDYSMTFKDTRPGYERSGEGRWHRDPDRVDGVLSPINYSLLYRDGKLIDPWGNVYNK